MYRFITDLTNVGIQHASTCNNLPYPSYPSYPLNSSYLGQEMEDDTESEESSLDDRETEADHEAAPEGAEDCV